MPVKENSIHTPREEMAELQKAIEGEKELRKSLRISLSPDYYAKQKAYLEEQLQNLQRRLEILNESFNSGEEKIRESFQRQSKLVHRYNCLKHRDKIARMEALKAKIEGIEKETK